MEKTERFFSTKSFKLYGSTPDYLTYLKERHKEIGWDHVNMELLPGVCDQSPSTSVPGCGSASLSRSGALSRSAAPSGPASNSTAVLAKHSVSVEVNPQHSRKPHPVNTAK